MALKYGLVVGNFGEVVGDRGASDPDRYPDQIGSQGKISFKPSAASITDIDPDTGRGTFVVPRTVEVTTDTAGRIVDASGAEGIWLVAGIEYTVTTTFVSFPGTVKIVPTEANDLAHPLDLVLALPLVPAPSVKFVVNEQVSVDAKAAAASAAASAVRAEQAAESLEGGELVDSGARTAAANAQSTATAAQNSADAKYTLPAGKIPDTDLSDAVRALLNAAGTAVQPATLTGYVPTGRSFGVGTGLSGGGTLAADRTISLSPSSITSLGKADSAVQPSALATALAAKADASALAGKADLVGGVLPTSQLPALAISDVFPVASQSAMLGLTAQRGDMAIRSDINRTYVLSTDDPTALANWLALPDANSVTSVNGQQGVVVLGKGDVGLGNVDNTSDANKPVSTAQQTALNLKAPLASPTFTGTVGGITKSMVGLGNVDNTSDANKPVSTAQQTALDAKVGSSDGTIKNVVALTQSAFNALTTKVATTLYVITG